MINAHAYLLSKQSKEKHPKRLDLACQLNRQSSLFAAVDNGADCIQYKVDEITLAHGLSTIGKGFRYAQSKNCRVALRVDVCPARTNWDKLINTIDDAAEAGVDALILSDPGLLLYATVHHPTIPLHYAVPASCLNASAINYFERQFGIACASLPNFATFAEAEQLARHTTVKIEVVGFGARAPLSPNRETLPDDCPTVSGSSLGEMMLAQNEQGSTEFAANDTCYSIGAMANAGALQLLPRLAAAEIAAVTIEMPPAGCPDEVGTLTNIWRQAIDDCLTNNVHFYVRAEWIEKLNRLTSA